MLSALPTWHTLLSVMSNKWLRAETQQIKVLQALKQRRSFFSPGTYWERFSSLNKSSYSIRGRCFIGESNQAEHKPIVVMAGTNSFCFNLKRIDVLPPLSKPKATTLISIFGPMCTRLSLVKANGMFGSSVHNTAKSVNTCCCCCTVSSSVTMLERAWIT